MTTPPSGETATVPDRIEKRILLRATRDRVWRALTDHREFGTWFGMRIAAPFAPHTAVQATIVPTAVDDAVAAQQRQFEGIAFELRIERIEPQQLFSFRWHPGAVEPGVDYATEPTTLVEFTLADAEGGILLTVVESGFGQLPLARRAQAFTGNEQGWALVVTLIEKYLAREA